LAPHLRKKHYERIADVVRSFRRSEVSEISLTAYRIAHDLAEYFAEDNHEFDRKRFLADCECGEPEVTSVLPL
jgi:hypothetical protein